MNEIEYAITNFEEFLEADIGQGDLHMCSVETALTALKEQQERERGCEHCRGWDKRCGANYCPMCGRKLGEWNG
jgi:hypothetical protein